ncbi:terminase large subunit [Phocaeicola phage BD26P3]|nr:terminase large subunit [Phocaeicola phage BD26P1]WAX06066.1 terminase large subunit [Phocaeicola phage BD26P2]WAX06099.1 terminase large subunit [Phocaeicola phage BD26P3]WAX06163.1 terminase large subunit [Phocaeicola phage BD26P4]WAX06196.1 terminase large subunit [Phocaeicola phage BD26P5]
MNVTFTFEKLLGAFVNPRYRGVASKGGTRSGKTWAVLQMLHILAKTNPNPLVISCVAATFPMVKRGMLRDFKAMVAAEGDWDENRFNKTESTYEYESGTIIEFFSCDNAGKVHGPARDVLYINEAQGIPREIYRQLDIRTRKKVVIDFNPVRKFWGETEFTGERYVTIHSTYLDNPYLTPEQVHAIEKNKNDKNWWRVYGEGMTGGVEGNVYPEYEVIDEMPEVYTGRCLGLDFGFTNDPTAIVDIRFEGYNLFLDLLMYETGLTNPQIGDYLTGQALNRIVTVCDSAEQKSIVELQRAKVKAIPAIKGKGSIASGIQQVKPFKLFVTKRSTHMMDELDNYKWVKDELNDTYTNVPIDAWNHSLDAMRYGVDYLLRKYRPKAFTQ